MYKGLSYDGQFSSNHPRTYIIGHHGIPKSPGMMMKTAHICAFFFAHTTRGHIYNLV